MAQCVKCSLHKHEDLSSGPQNARYKVSVEMATCTSATEGQRRGNPGARWPVSLAKTLIFGLSGGLVSENKVERRRKKDLLVSTLDLHTPCPLHMPICPPHCELKCLSFTFQ